MGPHSQGDWLIEIVHDVDGPDGFYGIDVDAKDLPQVSFYTATTSTLHHASRNETAWDESVVEGKPNADHSIGFAVGPDRVPHICYKRGVVDVLIHAYLTPSGWENEVVDDVTEFGNICTIAVDSLNRIHIAYYDFDKANLRYAYFNGTSWSNELVDGSFRAGGWNSLALDSSQNPSIAYVDMTNATIRYAERQGSGWGIEVVDSDATNLAWPSMDFDPNDNPHIAFIHKGRLRHAWKESGWRFENVLPDEFPSYPTLRMSSDGEPHFVFWVAGTYNYTIKHNGKWMSETIWETNEYGLTSALELDSKDLPHVAFLDRKTHTVYYATKANFSSDLPPVANSGGPYISQEGSSMTFDGTGSTDPEGGTLSFTWDFDSLVDSNGDGNFINDVDATGPTPTHTYYDNNIYTVTLTVTDDSGQSDTSTSTATVLNVAPTAQTNGPFQGDEPHTIQFTGTFTDPGTLDTHTFQWDFDYDGITFNVDSTEQNPTHQWLDDFNGSVAFKVTDDDGGWGMDVTHVTVNNLPPNATANGPYNSFEGSPVQFTGDHTDPGPLDTHTYEWDFSYDGTTFNPEATGNPYQNTWFDDHTGNIALRVTDDDGGWDLDVTTVTIVNVPPIADAGDNKEGYEVSTFTFNGSFYDPGAGDTHTFEWDFDYDGVNFDVDSTGQTATHTWTDDFDGLIALRVTDDDGGSDIDTAQVLVKNVAPTVTLEVLPIEVNAFLRIAGEKWHDVSIELFEDGVLIANGTLVRYPGSPDEQMLDLSGIQFDYLKRYTATVTYTPDDDPINGQPQGSNPCWIILNFSEGQELWIHHTFNVNHPDTYVWEVDLTAAILSHGMTFEATAFDPGADELTFTWDFGDGTNGTSFHSNGNGTYPVQIVEIINHAFPGSGTYVVVLTVEDDDGGVGTASVTIVIP
jgi:PKD repeat protein